MVRLFWTKINRANLFSAAYVPKANWVGARILKMDKIPTIEEFPPCAGRPLRTGFSRFAGNLQPDQMEVMDE
jgi:hypothetical protein